MYWITFILQTTIWIPTRLFLWFFLRFQVVGKENLKGLKTGVIFAINHLSELDVILLPASLNPFSVLMPIFYVSKKRSAYKKTTLRSYFYGTYLFNIWGAYPVIAGLKDYKKSLAKHIDLLKKGKNICIFPAGKKGKNPGRLQKLKGGIVALSKETGAKIVPVAISGHFEMSWQDILFRKRKVRLVFGKPIASKELFASGKNISPKNYMRIANEKIAPRIIELFKA